MLYQQSHEKIRSQAHEAGLEKKGIVDKRPAEGVGKLIVEQNSKINVDKEMLEKMDKNEKLQIKNRQQKIREEANLFK